MKFAVAFLHCIGGSNLCGAEEHIKKAESTGLPTRIFKQISNKFDKASGKINLSTLNLKKNDEAKLDEPLPEDSGDDSDGLYDFKDTLGEQQFPTDLGSIHDLATHPRRPRPCEYLYGKRYTARYIRRVDPSQLPSLMSLKVPPPPSERASHSKKTNDEESELTKLVQTLARPLRERRRRGSPEISRRRRSPVVRRRHRSRSPDRRPESRERLHRSPTGIERYRYWTGREYRSRNRSSDRRRSRHQ